MNSPLSKTYSTLFLAMLLHSAYAIECIDITKPANFTSSDTQTKTFSLEVIWKAPEDNHYTATISFGNQHRDVRKNDKINGMTIANIQQHFVVLTNGTSTIQLRLDNDHEKSKNVD